LSKKTYSFTTAATAADARFEAQRIAFAPVVFQVVQVLRREGLLRTLVAARDWVRHNELIAASRLSDYAITVLLETAYAAGIVDRVEQAHLEDRDVRWRATMVGRVIERDPLVGINMDFVGDVCYRSLAHLGEALRSGTPAGLAEFGPWKTFYEGMAGLPEPARASWFAYDHFYSDSAFPDALDALALCGATHIADVGANTGKFAVAFFFSLAALILFAGAGQVRWLPGIALGAGSTVGGIIGARLVISKGATWVRAVVVISAIAAIVKLLGVF